MAAVTSCENALLLCSRVKKFQNDASPFKIRQIKKGGVANLELT